MMTGRWAWSDELCWSDEMRRRKGIPYGVVALVWILDYGDYSVFFASAAPSGATATFREVVLQTPVPTYNLCIGTCVLAGGRYVDNQCLVLNP